MKDRKRKITFALGMSEEEEAEAFGDGQRLGGKGLGVEVGGGAVGLENRDGFSNLGEAEISGADFLPLDFLIQFDESSAITQISRH